MSHKDHPLRSVDGVKIVYREQIAPPLGTPQKPRGRFVPIVPNGCDGLSSCCQAAVTYSGETLCCKACWHEVETVHVASQRLEDAIMNCIKRSDPNRDYYAELKAVQAEVLAECFGG